MAVVLSSCLRLSAEGLFVPGADNSTVMAHLAPWTLLLLCFPDEMFRLSSLGQASGPKGLQLFAGPHVSVSLAGSFRSYEVPRIEVGGCRRQRVPCHGISRQTLNTLWEFKGSEWELKEHEEAPFDAILWPRSITSV